MNCRNRAEPCAVVRADDCAEKSIDAETFAEGMQKVRLKLYGYSTELNADKRGHNGLTWVIRFYPPNSRSIFGLQKKMAPMQNIVQMFVQ